MQLTTKQRAMVARGENITDANGETIAASWFRGGERAAVSVLISGDTAATPEAWDASLSPTLLIHEATYLEQQQDKAEEHMHSTATGAVASAHAVGAGVGVDFHPSVGVYIAQDPTDGKLNHVATQLVPRHPLPGEVGRGDTFG